jgi:hypothetical protein
VKVCLFAREPHGHQELLRVNNGRGICCFFVLAFPQAPRGAKEISPGRGSPGNEIPNLQPYLAAAGRRVGGRVLPAAATLSQNPPAPPFSGACTDSDELLHLSILDKAKTVDFAAFVHIRYCSPTETSGHRMQPSARPPIYQLCQ